MLSFCRRWRRGFSRVTTALVLTGCFSYKASALDLDPDEIRGSGKKQSIAVLQQRFFLKSKRPELGLIMGSMLNEAYTKTYAYGLRSAFFFSEWIGVEFEYVKTTLSDSDDRKALNQLVYRPKNPTPDEKNGTVTYVTPDPEVNPIHSYTDVNFVAAPFYGKLNFLDKLILYSDLYLTTGLSKVDTDQGSKMAFVRGAGQRFYIQNSWSVRVDFRDHTYTEQRAGQSTRKNALSFDAGFSYFFL